MSFLRSIKNSIDLKRNRLFLFFSIISIFLALSAFFRFLQFNQTGYLGKIFIFLPLYLFFFFSLIEFCPPSLNHFFKNRINIIIAVGAIITVTVVFNFLPYQFAPFRTQHTLTISVPETSSPITLQKITDIAGNNIDSTDANSFAIPDSIIIQPSESLSLKQAMTGGVTIFVTANHFPANVEVNWDGVVNQYEISLDKVEIKITTKASSWGVPTASHVILAVLNLFSDWVSCIFLLILMIRLGITWINKNGLKFSEPQFINPFFLLIQFVLLVGAGVFINIPDSSQYLLYVLIGISLSLWVLLFALGNSEKNIPWVSIFSWLFSKKYVPIYFFTTLSILAILGNTLFFLKRDNNRDAAITRMGTSVTNLLFVFSSDSEFVLSIEFYKQLDQANIIISERIVQKINLDTGSFFIRNHLTSLNIEKYNDYLSVDQVEALMSDDRLITFENAREPFGYYHMLETSNNDSHTYVFFQFENDIFLLPENFLKVSLP
jgi:hypothetical protein